MTEKARGPLSWRVGRGFAASAFGGVVERWVDGRRRHDGALHADRAHGIRNDLELDEPRVVGLE